jgi:hypothetical protein
MIKKDLEYNLALRGAPLLHVEKASHHQIADVLAALFTTFPVARYIACIPVILAQEEIVESLGVEMTERRMQNLAGFYLSQSLGIYNRFSFNPDNLTLLQQQRDYLLTTKDADSHVLTGVNKSRLTIHDETWNVHDFDRRSDFRRMMTKYLKSLPAKQPNVQQG